MRKATRTDYASYADTISQQFFSKSKLFWSWANRRKAYRSPIPVCKHSTSDTLLTSDYDKAEAFSNHFSSVFTREDTSDIASLRSAQPPNKISSSLSTISIHPSDVYQVLIHLDISKACGPNLLSPHLFKEAAPVISPSLAGLFNKSIQDGSLPEDWVSANIAPVFKRGNKHLISNYQPISLTSIVSKVLERLIHHKLYSFLEQQEVISHTQFGFHKRRSTVHLLLSAVDDWARTLYQRGSTHCLFLDFSKAFDTVPHQQLLLKLQHYSVEGCLLNWFRAFLMHRRQRVVINGCASHWTPVLSGVPQGSILAWPSVVCCLYE